MRRYLITIKCGRAVRLQFEAMACDRCTAAAQHIGLAEPGEYVWVEAVA